MKHGFSLVELSIVLVILGLLTGGILAGQSLIRASELRSVAADQGRFVTAAQTFRDKYFAIPGDFRDATRFWTRQVNAAHCVTNSSAAVSTPGTCDGDGDGTLQEGGAASESQERYQFWRQLAHAGLIEGTYSGTANAGGSGDSSSVNVPVSKLSSGLWFTNALANYAGDSDHYALDYGNYLALGAVAPTFDPYLPIMRPEEAWNIDTKMDDGKPARGKVVANNWNNLCAAADDGSHANNDLAASYKLSDTALRCRLFFIKQF